MVKIFNGDGWINNQWNPVTYIKASDCDFNPENYEKVLKEYDEALIVDSEIVSTYMKYNVGYNPEYGKGFYEGGFKKGTKGASEYFYAKTKYKD